MKCPFCGYKEDKVIDSRESRDGLAVRRRRQCLKCAKRFTTYEEVEVTMPLVVKRDGRREPFNRQKILNGIVRACEKRPVSLEAMERIVGEMEKKIQDQMKKEISSTEIGEMVVRKLHSLDEVAYVRFASVYRRFKDVSEFMDEVKRLVT